MSGTAFALADCNNFFVSCERVFRPDLEGRPAVVLSNNDGCVISRSEEAKELGIGMAVPVFEVRHLFAEHKVAALSANHELYCDMSRRVGEVLRRHAPLVENYSVDESFLTLPLDQDLEARARELRAEVLQWTGIPVAVGLGPSKALAKLASDRAKKRGGVYSLLNDRVRASVLDETPVIHIWGIARRLSDRLAEIGVRTAGELCARRDAELLKVLGIGGLRLVWELRGTPCVELARVEPERKSVTVSRSFGKAVFSREALEGAAARFAAQAAERLRRHGLRAGAMSAFVGWREDRQPRSVSNGRRLTPTDDSRALMKEARALVGSLFEEGRAHKKAGIVLTELSPSEEEQAPLFAAPEAERSTRLMKALDGVNARLGPETLRWASTGASKEWAPRCETRSPCWTTRWEDLPIVKN